MRIRDQLLKLEQDDRAKREAVLAEIQIHDSVWRLNKIAERLGVESPAYEKIIEAVKLIKGS